MNHYIPICKKCGWYREQIGHEEHWCDPRRGKIADRLVDEANERFSPPTPATKLGYGSGFLTFEVDDNTHLRLRPNLDNTFHVEDVFILDNLTREQVLHLVATLRNLKSIT